MASDGIESKSSKRALEPEAPLPEEGVSGAIEISGVIKWFDVAKGYGFIVPDNSMADVLLHVTCLRRDGYQTAYEGSRVVCEVLAGPKVFRLSGSSPWMSPPLFIRRRCHHPGPMLRLSLRVVSSEYKSNGSIGFAGSAS